MHDVLPMNSVWRVGRFRLVVNSVAALICVACGNSFTPVEPTLLTIEVTGTVMEINAGSPIDSAFIEVRTDFSGGFAEAYSDSTGQYSYSFVYRFIPGEFFCPFTVFVSAEDFWLETFPLTCVEGVQTIDVLLEPVDQAEERSQR